jgi:uroporphyrinogen-III synthase
MTEAQQSETNPPLAGRGVVVTRPAQQAPALLDALRAEGADPLFFPVIEILPLADVTPLRELIDKLPAYDLVFFVSANAVEQALAVMPRIAWPTASRVATVGPGSARALQAHGFRDVMLPASQFDSEGVLQLAALQASEISNKRVLILRGDGGRELLAEGLRERGARVDVVACYRRKRADADPSEFMRRFAEKNIHAISFTSSEGARNLVDVLERYAPGSAREVLTTVPCFAPHRRIENFLTSLGAQHTVLTDAGDAALILALRNYFR